MSVLQNHTLWIAACGGAGSYYTNYAYGSNQSTALVGAIGAVASAIIFRLIPETGFKPFHLDIEKFRYVGSINNNNLFAHRCQTLSKINLCSYLRKMDSQEYKYVKKDHDISVEARKGSVPFLAGVLTFIGVTGLSGFFSLPSVLGSAVKDFFVCGGFLWMGGTVVVGNIESSGKTMDINRSSRLNLKILKLSKRIVSLERRGGYPREILQLGQALGYFTSTFQRHSNKITVYHTT